MLRFNLFPGGKEKAITLSWDDGRSEDRRLVEIMNRYGIRGTFHINTAFEGNPKYIPCAEYKTLYEGHEISCHGDTHPDYTNIPASAVAGDLIRNKLKLEEACGYPVRGMSYPYGRVNAAAAEQLRLCGMEYSRTTENNPAGHRFELPADFMYWNPTCKHYDCLTALEEFRKEYYKDRLCCLYVWGHSYEFTVHDNWGLIERFCREAGALSDVWYATNIEIMDYQNAIRALRVSADGTLFYNPSRLDIWASSAKNGKTVIPAGQTVRDTGVF